MTNIKPLNFTRIKEINLPRAPLERVISEIRFGTILGIRNPERVVVFHEMLNGLYPYLNKEIVQSIKLFGSNETEDIHNNIIWRITDYSKNPQWKVSLGEDFVALETTKYTNRNDFIDRLSKVLKAVESTFAPPEAIRLGLRYIDRLTDEAVDSITDFLQPELLGIYQPAGKLNKLLNSSVISQISEVQFYVSENSRLNARWGLVPINSTDGNNTIKALNEPSWVIDLDMITNQTIPFISNDLVEVTAEFSENIYGLFRQMVTEDFIRYYGGEV